MSAESLIVIFLALAAGSLVKGIAGLGLPLVAIPVMAGFIGVERAVVLMVIPGFLINLWLMWTYRAHATALPNPVLIVAVAVIGVVLGAWVLAAVPERYLIVFMAIWIGLYLVKVLVLRADPVLPASVRPHLSALVVLIAGMIQGATGVSGPVLATYAHALKLPQPAYVFTISVLFQVFSITQMIAFIWLGMMTMDRVYDGLLAIIPVTIFLPIAVYLSRFIGPRMFNAMIIAVLIVMETRLVLKAFA